MSDDKPLDYELNEKDIDSVIAYLKSVNPEIATPEMAIEYLETMNAMFHAMSHENPDLLEKLHKLYPESKQ